MAKFKVLKQSPGLDVATKLQQVLLANNISTAAKTIRQWLQSSAEFELIKTDTHSCVGLIQLGEQGCYLKLYQAKSKFQSLLFNLGIGRAKKNFIIAEGLDSQGIKVPQALACIAVSGGMILINQALQGAVNLDQYWRNSLDSEVSSEQASSVLEQTANCMAKLHRAGFSHGDAKWNNIMLLDQQLYWVDLDGVSKASLGDASTARDVARFALNAESLNLSDDIFQSFLQAYLDNTGLPRAWLLESAAPILNKLRLRHIAKYGHKPKQRLLT